MSSFDFDCYNSRFIVASFRCDRCEEQVHSEPIDVSEPDYSGSNARDSSVETEGEAVCSRCEKHFEVKLFSSLGGGWGDVIDLDNSVEVIVEEEMDIRDREQYLASISDSSQIKYLEKTLRFVEQITNENRNRDDEFSICVMLHLHCVAALERYLASRFIALVLQDKNILRKFVEHDKELKNRTFPLSDLFRKNDDIKKIVAARLDKIYFHRTNDIRVMYKATLNVNLGDLRWFQDAVAIRHDCAHRAGADKNGKNVIVNYQSVRELRENCLSLANNVELQAPLETA